MHEKVMQLFVKSCEGIPAYKRFLGENGINSVQDVGSVHDIPVISKKNYLRIHKHTELMWSEDQKNLLSYCATSGSTGEPYYFPRNDVLSDQYSLYLEEFIKQSSYGDGRTLVILGFGMGVWIGGLITLSAFEAAARRGDLPVSILPTGYSKNEIFKGLKNLAPQHDQTIIVGYPPFVKDLVDEASDNDIDLKKLNIRFLFAAETFTETYRSYVCKKAGVKSELLDTLNIYGSADIGAMARETPLSIFIRKIALEDPLLFKELFGQIEKTPTLAQYNPDHIVFEEVDGELVLTANSALPLVRYAIGDHGGVINYDEIITVLSRHNIDLEAEVEAAGIESMSKTEPFVYVYERTDLSTTLHGINVYPEFVKEALLNDSISDFFTERFTMSTKHDIRHNQFLLINLELRKGVEPTKQLAAKAAKVVSTELEQKSSEFTEISKSAQSSKLIKIELWPKNHPRYFAAGTKQKWVEKQ